MENKSNLTYFNIFTKFNLFANITNVTLFNSHNSMSLSIYFNREINLSADRLNNVSKVIHSG